MNNNSHIKNWHKVYKEKQTFGQKLADQVASGMGSWKFIITQTIIVVLWIVLNLFAYIKHWDPYPFILLNLLFSTQAAYAAPIIMMSQNRQSQRDREHAEADYQVNVKSKKEIESIIIKLNDMELEKLDKIIELLLKNQSHVKKQSKSKSTRV